MKKTLVLIITILILSIPAFSLMLRPGIYAMHDFHVFRLQQFDKCIQNFTFPCRWAPDSGKGYGEPLFNFYGQFPYWIGEAIHLIGFSILNSTKLMFIFSITLSGVAMFFLSRRFWGNVGGVVSAIFYMYAPYRAIDLWVRGALNESLAFVFFPLIFLFLDLYIQKSKTKYIVALSLALAGLITTHNLSVMIFAPFMLVWWLFRCLQHRSFKSFFGLSIAAIVSLFLSAYYLLPVALESKYITLAKTTQGYYDYRAHFTSLYQLFVSNFWGYGGSTWGPNDTMSFSVGHLHWIIPAVIILVLIYKYLTSHPSPTVGEGNARGEVLVKTLIFTSLGLFALFLTHNKSAFIWTHLYPMAYIQFPWRFLTMAVLFLSLACGALAVVFSKRLLLSCSLTLLLLLNFSFYHPDIWRPITDKEQFSGALWDEQRSSALQDFWPVFGSDQPTSFAPTQLTVVIRTNDYQKIRYPIVYFPGWIAKVDNRITSVFPDGKLGLIAVRVPLNYSKITLKFVNTWPRTLGNSLSLITLISLLVWHFSKNHSHS